MAVGLLEGKVAIVRLAFKIEELPDYLQKGLDADPTTLEVENLGQTLVRRGFPDEISAEFVRQVCKWGNYAGVYGKVLRGNKLYDISQSLSNAYLFSQNEKIDDALKELLNLHGLGVSFATKHLKFLDPQRHVVLDSIISERLGYRRTVDGYREFVADCTAIRMAALEAGIVRPDGGQFRVADVEMAIYQMLTSNSKV